MNKNKFNDNINFRLKILYLNIYHIKKKFATKIKKIVK